MDKAKDLYKLQRDAKKIKNELKNIHVEAESGCVIVTVNGEQKFIEVKINKDITDFKKIEKDFIEAANKGVKKSQEIAAEKMKSAMGGLEGMFG